MKSILRKHILPAKDYLVILPPLLLGPALLLLLSPWLKQQANLSLSLLLWLLLLPLFSGGVAGWRHPRSAAVAGLQIGLALGLLLLALLASFLPRLLLPLNILVLLAGALLLSLLAAYIGAGLKQAAVIVADIKDAQSDEPR